MKIINKNVEMLHCNISNKKKPKAFTLVELIIVITILAILATIAFVGFQNFTKDARDGNRITTLKNIESGLTLYNIKSNKYPDPEEYVEILSGNILLIKQGIVGNEVVQKIKLNKEAKDPKDKTNYIYSITGNGKKYQLGTYLEVNNFISHLPQITKTYATDVNNIDYTNRYFYTIGHKVGILLEEQTQKPILKTETLTGINLETNTDSFKVYFSNDTQSGSYTSSGTELIETIVENQKTTQTIKTSTQQENTPEPTPPETSTPSCATPTPSGEGIASTVENPTSENQEWQKDVSSCGFTCKAGYTGNTCNEREVYGDEDPQAIAACNKWVELAIGENAGGHSNWIWVPANPANNGNFTTDGTGTPLTDDFYKRTVTHNGINYTCKGFAVMKYEAKFLTDQRTEADVTWKSRTCSDYMYKLSRLCRNFS